jgi:hypothetical protein
MLRGQKRKEIRLQQWIPSNGKTMNDKFQQRMVLKQSCFKNKITLILIQIFIPTLAQDGNLSEKTFFLVFKQPHPARL